MRSLRMRPSTSHFAIVAALLLGGAPLAGQGLQTSVDSSQTARARGLCGPLFEDSLTVDPLWPAAGALVSWKFNRLEPPRRLPDNVSVDYPQALRDRAIQGTVAVVAIVDTTGLIEPSSVKVVSTPDEGFFPAVQRYLALIRFRPGRVHERPVRVCAPIFVPFVLSQR